MLTHLGGILFGFIPSLVIWLVSKETSPWLADQAKEALNFQITIAIAAIISSLLMFLLIGFIVLPLVIVLDVVLCIIAALKANQGQIYRYPLTLRLIA